MEETSKGKGDEGGLYTLTDVAKATGISMPTLQRYKRLYQSRIPSRGKGRKQRYPKEALKVFEELKTENMSKRGRPAKKAGARKSPRKKASASSRGNGRRKAKTAARKVTRRKTGATRKSGSTKKRSASGASDNYLTLTEIGKKTGISYPTLLRYVRLHLKRIPHKGTGRTRRFKPEAVAVFEQLRKESPRGRRKGSVKRTTGRASQADKALAQKVRELERQVKALSKVVNKPLKLTINR